MDPAQSTAMNRRPLSQTRLRKSRAWLYPEFIHAEIQTDRRFRDAMVVAGIETGTNGRSTWRACVLFPGRALSVDPGGVASISRGLSAATPPESRVILIPTPEGSQRRLLTTQSRYFSSNSISALRSPSISHGNNRCRVRD